MFRWCTALLALVLCACGGGGGGGGTTTGTTTPPPPVVSAEVSMLFMGNSHTSFNNLPAMVGDMVRAMRPGTTVAITVSPEWLFLDERSVDAASLALLRSRAWSAVVLQAQKYSTSGLFTYSTTGAESLVRESRAVGALPILFPEWARRDIDETNRIYDLHVSIAAHEPACVAPIGQAWDLAFARYPGIVLHAADGNHAAEAGSFLAALVIASTFTKVTPLQVPALAGYGVDAVLQEQLRGVAADTVITYPPRQWCPQDALR